MDITIQEVLLALACLGFLLCGTSVVWREYQLNRLRKWLKTLKNRSYRDSD